MPDARVLSWRRVDGLLGRLAGCIAVSEPNARFERIVAVARGGLVPAGLLAGRLGIERVESVQVRAYDGRAGREAPALLGSAPAAAGPSGDPARTLVVDELIESGATLGLLASLLPGARHAVLVVKGDLLRGRGRAPGRVAVAALAARGLPAEVFAAQRLPADRWVVFPWSPAAER